MSPIARLALVDVTLAGRSGFVLGPLSLVVERGALTALAGPAGGGKSLLLYALAGLVDVAHGSVRHDDEDASSDLRRARAALAFQRDALLHDRSVLENVRAPAAWRGQGDAHDRAIAALRAIGLSSSDDDKAPRALSGGMRRRVGIARALAVDAPVLLVDDPTAGLDPLTAADLVALLVDESARRIVVVATSDVDLVLPAAHRLLLLDEGRARFVGAVRDLPTDSPFAPRVAA